ncbi:hypothetical protein C8R47DRAFT_1082864 [Mycena vitilis]|nr:hypothetical protein C8R47DRAFT_1082864 [Mycena vitilis]
MSHMRSVFSPNSSSPPQTRWRQWKRASDVVRKKANGQMHRGVEFWDKELDWGKPEFESRLFSRVCWQETDALAGCKKPTGQTVEEWPRPINFYLKNWAVVRLCHEDRAAHDRCAQCVFYGVFNGWVRGGYSNSWIARAQTDHFSEPQAKSFKKWADLIAWWNPLCNLHHAQGCPPFEPVTFSLNANPHTQPGPGPCTFTHHAAAHGGSAGPVAPPASAASTSAGPATVLPTAAPSPFSSSSSAATSSSSSSLSSASSLSLSSADVKKEEPTTPRLKKEETSSPRVLAEAPGTPDLARIPRMTARTPITPDTRVYLTRAGEVYADQVAARAAHAVALTPARGAISALTPTRGPSNVPRPRTLAPPVAGPSRAPATDSGPPPSILVTPRVAVGTARAADTARPERRPRRYGIRGVAVFYNSFQSAADAARALELDDSKIMFSSNPAKLEAWMSGQPFVGEEDEE